ncbi:uncharacterized protein LODBEIA_P18430 [Lodderomyces beijingensis]|uniref:Hikeshi-like domain-containing protein n=1 Tax=Lodderomyces beijingensis TaxID=1775926 RepID=A0ABP0ZHH9_9ASCO
MSTNNVFGAICSGRPIILAQQVDTTKYMISIPNASKVHYVTIFLLPNSPFVDPNLTALVYFQTPSSPAQLQQQQPQQSSSPEFRLLGALNPEKPSAIYKLNNLAAGSGASQAANRSSNSNGGMDLDMGDGDAAANAKIDPNDPFTINIGISIEPTAQAEQTIAQARADHTGLVLARNTPASVAAKDPNSTAVLANKIVGHAYNYLASFIDASGKVPIKAFDNWWEKFKTKLQNNPNFLNEIQE